ncbi:DUF3365 domain-containing protein [Candidatus Nitronereus thalassa]|uniref:DUF3365 domain-containing protein n=1 Tax=Candidatus Nitronereus thalassa TaxID=3020898 RepID=A0ABU3K7K2_9BACT|nr:DUF3365 domain-containing protein [Candidatus Nitronereus thalassa]MDT7042347.1 DUF3365 domain-containing protein [Candidatus Nitronereus thalassa]
MNLKTTVLPALALLVGIGIGWGISMQDSPENHIPARTAADYLHAVIEADRTFYTQHIVERMEAMLIVTASEEWVQEKTLPLPVQFLREASRSLDLREAPIRYRLIGSWPLNAGNKPVSNQERQMLDQVVKFGEVVESEVTINDRRYFQAIYPDRAVSRACVSCHNTHADSPKRDFKLNDVMGGLVIEVPLE